MKNLTISKKKIISDNVLSFLFLINKINYKKLKSSAKRPLLPHYVFYKFFIKALKFNFNKSWYRNFAQSNNNLQIILPSLFVEKRMFFKTTKLLSLYQNSLQNSYAWFNKKTIFFLKKNTHFSKINIHPVIGGQNILSSTLPDIPKEEQVNILIKDFFLKDKPNFNMFIFFNLNLLNMLEFYKVLTLLWFNRLNN